MLCSTAAYPSGNHAPPPLTNAEPIYATNGANANKGSGLLIHLLEFIFVVLDYWTPSTTYDEPVCRIHKAKALYLIFNCRFMKETIAIVIFFIHL